MSQVIAYDLSRLFIGPIFATPRGIDRVDLALARHIFADGNDQHMGILPTPWGVRALPAMIVRRALTHLKALWAEDANCEDDRTLQALIRALQGRFPLSDQPDCDRQVLSTRGRARRMLEHIRATGFQLWQSADSAVPHGAAYLNVGQIGLAVPLFYNWLARRPDVTCTIMLHDVIPLEYPHLVMPGSVAHHARMVETAARRAHCLLFNTVSARDSVSAALAELGRTQMPSLVRSLPLASAFVEADRSLSELKGVDYFVAVSTIEPRKNFELLFEVWQRIEARRGSSTPHLIIVGSPGYEADLILGRLEEVGAVRSRIHHISGLSSSGLATLILGASGMLSPSFAEGFGLPVLEANAMGVPTIASDIAAHREVADASTILLPVDDPASWEREILAVQMAGVRKRPSIPYRMTEAAYCADVVAFLRDEASARNRVPDIMASPAAA